MNNNETLSLSRRKWFEQMSVPLIGASLGAGPFGTSQAAAEQANSTTTDEKNLGARVYNVRDFGAKGDGAMLDTVAIQAAIDACTKDISSARI